MTSPPRSVLFQKPRVTKRYSHYVFMMDEAAINTSYQFQGPGNGHTPSSDTPVSFHFQPILQFISKGMI